MVEVAELFAGVGGFRLGLEGAPSKEWETDLLKVGDTGFKVIWSNQWEPPANGQKSEPKQWASIIYEKRFDSGAHVNEDIEKVWRDVPDHQLLVGGFPCQDYSTARTRSGEMGIKGEKGKLWTSIFRIIKLKRPPVVFLENVPRLISSPSKQKGLNFGRIVNDLVGMGYAVEWRIINAADYGMPQRRRRVFILAYRGNPGGRHKKNREDGRGNFGIELPVARSQASDWLLKSGPFAGAFKVSNTEIGELEDLPMVGKTFDEEDWNDKKSPFKDAGYAFKMRPRDSSDHTKQRTIRKFWTFKADAVKEDAQKLEDGILVDMDSEDFDEDYLVTEDLDKWEYVKGSAAEYRIRKENRAWAENIIVGRRNLWQLYRHCMQGYNRALWSNHWNKAAFEKYLGENQVYKYSAGSIGFDKLSDPSRTVVTDEIGRTVSRMRHLIEYEEGKCRRLMPVETERLNQFPDGWTDIDDIKDSRRGFLMGNALVVGVISRLRKPLRQLINSR